MANGVNKVILIGRLGSDPEVRYTTNGGAVANFNLATNEVWMDKAGQKQERTEWHKIVVWGKTAELCGQYLSKGRQAYFEGRLQTREWTDKEGHKRYTTEVNAQTVQFLGGPGEKTSNANTGAGTGSGAGNDFAPSNQFEGQVSGEPSGAGMSDEEVPF